MRLKSVLIALFIAASATATSSYSAIASIDRTIGANLRQYQKPSHCDIKVPFQYATIQKGIDVAGNGAKVCVASGTFNEDVVVNKPVTLAGSGNNNRSIINGQNLSARGAVNITSNNVVIEGFEINGVDGQNSGLFAGAVMMSDGVSDTAIKYNRINAGNSEFGLLTDGHQSNNLISNNYIKGDNSPLIANVNGESSPSNKVDFLYNTFLGTIDYINGGIVFGDQATNSTVNFNSIRISSGCQGQIDVMFGEGSFVNYNNLSNACQYRAYDHPNTGTLNAEHNWWGDLDPSDNILNSVDYTPFATKPFREYPLI